MIIALRAPSGYLTAEAIGPDHAGVVTANRSNIGAWERWTVKPQGSGISLLGSHGFYICSEQGGGSVLICNREKADIWETFTVSPAGTIRHGDHIVLGCYDGMHYIGISPDENGAYPHVAHARGGPTTFTVEVIEADSDVSALSPLHADGTDIKTADGTRYVHNQATNYLLFQKFMEGRDIEQFLYDGFDGYNVTFLMKTVPEQAGLPALTPDNYPDLYRQADNFLRYVNSKGKRIEGTWICDNNLIGYSLSKLNYHIGLLRDVFSGHPGNLVQLANEWEKNGVDVMQFPKPLGVFSSRGSSLAGGPCPLPAWDYSTAHLSRQGGGAYLDAQPFYMIDGYSGYAGTHGPVITNETRGASDTENSDRRTTDPSYFRKIASAMRGYSGGTFHADFGIHSDPCVSGSKQDDCRKAWLEGIGA